MPKVQAKIINLLDFKDEKENDTNKNIYEYINKSNLNDYIDKQFKCWSDSFLKLNDGLEYAFFINHIALKFKLSKELSKTIFDSYAYKGY